MHILQARIAFHFLCCPSKDLFFGLCVFCIALVKNCSPLGDSDNFLWGKPVVRELCHPALLIPNVGGCSAAGCRDTTCSRCFRVKNMHMPVTHRPDTQHTSLRSVGGTGCTVVSAWTRIQTCNLSAMRTVPLPLQKMDGGKGVLVVVWGKGGGGGLMCEAHQN